MNIEKSKIDYPQVDRIDENGTQWIEVNRGCKRGCSFCHASPDYRTFPIPPIRSNIVQIIGEGFLYDPDIIEKIQKLSEQKVNGKVVYYGLSQGVDFRLLTPDIAFDLSHGRFGIINNKGNWSKGLRFAWDLGMEQLELVCQTIQTLKSVGYKTNRIQVFVLVNWKISYEVCLQKLEVLRDFGVKIDDCTWETTKREMKPMEWTLRELKQFRRKARKHNQLITFNGYDPEQELNQEYFKL